MPAEWYTVPPEYGGRTLSFRRRLFFEYLWRRHGTKGLYEYATAQFAKFAAASSAAMDVWTESFDLLAEALVELGTGLPLDE